MKAYSTFRPTGFDQSGLGLRDQQDWLVAPCSHNRDSGPLVESNWDSQLKALGGESDDVEVHRFGHWGPGWFEIVIINPARVDLVKIGEELESALAEYPVLNEEDYSRREWEDYTASWTACGVWRDFLKECRKEFGLSDATYYAMEDFDPEAIRALYEELIPSGDYYEACKNGANFGRRVERAVADLSRERLAKFIRENRNVVVA